MQFEVAEWRCRQLRDIDTGRLELWFEFGIKGPAKTRPKAHLIIAWPSGNETTISEGRLAFDKGGGVILHGNVVLANIVAGEYKFRLFVAEEDLGEFSFTVE